MKDTTHSQSRTEPRQTSDLRRQTAIDQVPARPLLPQLPTLSLYIHIPWCVRKCPYCDFNSHQQGSGLPEADYVTALLEDLDADLGYVQGRELQSIFFGGGTPSLFSAAAIGDILAGVERRIGFAPDIEITLEANPGTAEQERFRAYRAAGVNRLSLGVQSFGKAQLKALGRIHGREEALAAIAMARTAGFERCNIDLMHGLPGQTPEQALTDLDTALEQGVTHLSWYQLTIEPNTEFYKRPPTQPPENQLADIQELGAARLAAAGLQQYEISAYSAPGEHARHNLNYWQFGDYLGIGAGAHAKLSHADGQILRLQKTRRPEDYLARSGSRAGPASAIAHEELALEFMLNALRLTEGFDKALFCARTGLPWASIAARIDSLVARELLRNDGQRIAPTELGRRYLDDVVAAFLPE